MLPEIEAATRKLYADAGQVWPEDPSARLEQDEAEFAGGRREGLRYAAERSASAVPVPSKTPTVAGVGTQSFADLVRRVEALEAVIAAWASP
jgi:hypothetical protein